MPRSHVFQGEHFSACIQFNVYMRRYRRFAYDRTILICMCDTFLDRVYFGEYSNIYTNRWEYDVINSAHNFVSTFSSDDPIYKFTCIHFLLFHNPHSIKKKECKFVVVSSIANCVTKPVLLYFKFVHKFDINSVREKKNHFIPKCENCMQNLLQSRSLSHSRDNKKRLVKLNSILSHSNGEKNHEKWSHRELFIYSFMKATVQQSTPRKFNHIRNQLWIYLWKAACAQSIGHFENSIWNYSYYINQWRWRYCEYVRHHMFAMCVGSPHLNNLSR